MKKYLPNISANINNKGVLDIDSVKGCAFGMAKYPDGGCYGLCYAAKIAKLYKYDFTTSISRGFDTSQLCFDGFDVYGKKEVFKMVKNHNLKWFRIGTMGDPCHDWQLTLKICKWLYQLKTPVIITKHWLKIPETMLNLFKKYGVVFNTSISPLDTEIERKHRLYQFNRIKKAGIGSVLRIVSCKFGNTQQGKQLKEIQEELFAHQPNLDNPLRISNTDMRVVCGDILIKKIKDLTSKAFISIMNDKTYIGHCGNCPDQCGVL